MMGYTAGWYPIFAECRVIVSRGMCGRDGMDVLGAPAIYVATWLLSRGDEEE
jgi:hypothetical protein